MKLGETGLAQVMGYVGHDMEMIYLKYAWLDNHSVSN